MKNSYKAVLLAALGLAVVSAAQAGTSDVLLGFNDPNGPTSAQNDYVIDLGAASGFTVNTPATVFAIDPVAFNTAFGTDSSALNQVNVGAVEGQTGAYPKTLFETLLSATPTAFSSANFNNSAAAAQASPLGVQASATSGSWTSELGTIAGNPVQALTGGTITETLWEETRPSLLGAPSAWTDIGTLAIDANANTVTFTGLDAPTVPEPSTYGLIGVAGLVLVSFRNKLSRKQA
jgi:hypothetical protein